MAVTLSATVCAGTSDEQGRPYRHAFADSARCAALEPGNRCDGSPRRFELMPAPTAVSGFSYGGPGDWSFILGEVSRSTGMRHRACSDDDLFLSQIRRSMGFPGAARCMTMAIDEQIQQRLVLAYRLLALEIEHRDRVRAEALDDSDAEKAVRLRQACIERMHWVLARHHPVIRLRAG